MSRRTNVYDWFYDVLNAKVGTDFGQVTKFFDITTQVQFEFPLIVVSPGSSTQYSGMEEILHDEEAFGWYTFEIIVNGFIKAEADSNNILANEVMIENIKKAIYTTKIKSSYGWVKYIYIESIEPIRWSQANDIGATIVFQIIMLDGNF